jgi:predicted nucleic acid-binding Zn ribbon protein
MAPEVTCEDCGGNRFRYPPSLNDDTLIVCEDCGQSVGSVGDLKARIAAEVLRPKE